MRLMLRFLIIIVPALGLVFYGLTLAIEQVEKKWINNDLNQRAALITDTVSVSVEEILQSGKSKNLESFLSQFGASTHIVGLSVCTSNGDLIAKSRSLNISDPCDRNRSSEVFLPNRVALHKSAHPIWDNSNGVLAMLYVFQDTQHIHSEASHARQYLLAALVLIGFIATTIAFIVYRWTFHGMLSRLSQFVVAGRTRFAQKFENTDLAPFAKHLEKALMDLRSQKNSRISTTQWTASRLREETRRLFGRAKFCVIANREPYIHNRRGNNIEVLFPSSGLVSAVEPILRACSGLWIGHGSGSADRETSNRSGKLQVPPNRPEYVLKRVWLTEEEENGYYYGFSNEGLWPLCHIAHTRPVFRREDWEQYQKVNFKFAEAFRQEMKSEQTIALIQDYHFALLPEMLRKIKPELVSSIFWHIPWPNPESIAICPWKNQIMKGMLGSDLIGFHTQFHCNNFLDSVDRFLEARVDRENFSVTIQGHTCYVKPFPISIEWPPRNNADPEQIPEIRKSLLSEIGIEPTRLIGVGVDRLDYTKGIIERFLSIERLLEKYPQYIGEFIFIQVGAPSRTHIKRYKDFNHEVKEVTDRINSRFGNEKYQPIVLRLHHHDASEVFRFYRAANVCFVNSLHDGMNLVAKEFIASRSDEKGVLILSSFTGAAKELIDALIVNPYDVEENAEALHLALTMNPTEQQERMHRMRKVVATNNIYSWAARFLSEVSHIENARKARTLSQVI